jgi:hypothetical protein
MLAPLHHKPALRICGMSSHNKILGALAALLLLSGCASTFKASFDHDPANDFSGYKTFSWLPNPMKVGQTTGPVSPLLEPRITSAVEDALGAKGYEYITDHEKADFALSFTVGSRDEIKVDSYPSMSAGYYGRGYPAGWGWGGAYYGIGTETTVRQYTKGMLAIDVFDVKAHRPVWHGVATKNISQSDRDDIRETVNAAVAAIMAGFPPE